MQLFGKSVLLLCLSGLLPVHAWGVTSNSRTITLGGNASYFVPGNAAASFKFPAGSPFPGQLQNLTEGGLEPLIPFTFITTGSSSFSAGDLSAVVSLYSMTDDVWSSLFLTGIYIASNGTGSPTSSITAGNGTSVVITSAAVPLTASIPPGPYFVDPFTGDIFEAWLLYDDTQGSFLYGMVPNADGSFSMLSAKTAGAATVNVAVPSRLYFSPSPQQPLAGKRFGVKDLYDIKGLKTGGGSRSYYDTFPVKNVTAPAVQRLIDGGAIIVGKTKASQFANGETATDDWIDYHSPFNARGDGYQDGSASSTGSGTAMGAYPWLDYALGTDTGGSMRAPAGANGVYGNRPSFGAITLDGVLPLATRLDSAGVFARDPKSWLTVAEWWLQNLTTFTQYPKTILFPVDFFGSSFLTHPPANGTANAIYNDFITKLEGFLGTTRTEINLTSLWNTTSPLIANVSNPPPDLHTMFNATYDVVVGLDQVQLVADPLIGNYSAQHNGQQPPIDPAVTVRWNFAKTFITSDEFRNEGITNKTIYMNWFQNTVLNGTDNTTCSPAIYLYPQNTGTTNYRNAYLGGPPAQPFGFQALRASVLAEVPDLVLPLGEVPFNSTVTMSQHFLPVTISVVTQKHCDLMLYNLFAALQDAGILSPVKTGPTLFM